MSQSILNQGFELRKASGDIRNFKGDWKFTHIFEKLVMNLNKASKGLGLPLFQFEDFHYSNTGKTITEVGYDSLLTHISILEENNYNKKEQSFKTDVEVDNRQGHKKVFIVHGRDKSALLETESILNRVGLEPIILNRMVNSGLTLIEKFEKYSDVKYAIVLLTPDDIGALNENTSLELLDFSFRARQNVLFELGFFYGKLGRSNVCCVLKSTVEKPSDIDGIAYLPYKQSVEEIEFGLLRELKEAKLEFQIL